MAAGDVPKSVVLEYCMGVLWQPKMDQHCRDNKLKHKAILTTLENRDLIKGLSFNDNAGSGKARENFLSDEEGLPALAEVNTH